MAKELKAKVRIEADTKQATKSIGRFKRSIQGLGGAASGVATPFVAMKAGIAKLMVPVAAVTAALYTLKKAFDFIKEGAILQTQTESLKRNLADQGQAIDQWMLKLNEAARNQVSNADLIQSSSRAMLLGIPADRMADLMEVASASANAMGITVSEAFRSIAIGVGRQSPLILDNLGIVVKLGPAYDAYAKRLGTTSEALTTQQKRLALLESVLKTGEDRVRKFGDAQGETAKLINEMTTALENQYNKAKTDAVAFTDAIVIVTNHLKDQASDALPEVSHALEVFNDHVYSNLDLVRDLKGFLGGMGDAFRGFATGLSEAEVEQKKLNEASENYSHELAVMTDALLKGRSTSDGFASSLEYILGKERLAALGMLELSDSFVTVEKAAAAARKIMKLPFGPILEPSRQLAFDALTAAIQATTNSVKELITEEQRLAGTFDTFEAKVNALGVTLDSQLNKSIEENNALLLEAEERYYRSGSATEGAGISLATYNRIVEQVSASNEELNKSLGRSSNASSENSDSVDDLTNSLYDEIEATKEATSVNEDHAEGIKNLSNQMRELISLRAAANAALARQSGTGGIRRGPEVMAHEAAAWGAQRAGASNVTFIGSGTSASEDWQAIYGGHGSRLDVPPQTAAPVMPYTATGVNTRSARSGFSTPGVDWNAMSTDQRKRYIALGGKPEPAQIGWVEVKGS